MRSALMVVCAGALLGCSGGASSDDGAGGGEHVFRISGSDTELALVQAMAERHRENVPEVSISVSGGGSGAGIAALIEGRVDLANASRPAKAEEREAAEAAGEALHEIILAIDALAVIVNEDLGIDELSVEQIGRLYRAEVTNWSELGGPDREVTLYGRQSNSGTYDYFREAVLEADYALSMLNMNGNAQIVEAVRADRYGIGYVGAGYVSSSPGASEGLHVLSITTENGAISPLDSAAVAAGDYPVSRPLFQYARGAVPAQLRRFIAFELSDEGQEIVVESGFYPLAEDARMDVSELGQ